MTLSRILPYLIEANHGQIFHYPFLQFVISVTISIMFSFCAIIGILEVQELFKFCMSSALVSATLFSVHQIIKFAAIIYLIYVGKLYMKMIIVIHNRNFQL